MAGPLRYVGAAAASTADLTYRAYIASQLALNLPQSTVDALISTGFAPYVTKSYVDTQDTLNATKAFIDAGDNTKLKLAQKEVVNGIAALGATGRVNVSHVNVASTQRWPRPFISPTAYNTGNVTATGTEVLLYSPVTVADPGFAYRLLVTGLVDANTSVDGEFPVVRVRQGSSVGPVVAAGAGCAQTYPGGVLTALTTDGGQAYTIPPWSATLDVVCLGAGGGGAGSKAFVGHGVGGKQGGVASVTLVRGTDIPMGTNTLTVTVGNGGNGGAKNGGNGAAGGATTAIGAGWGGITGAAGVAGSGTIVLGSQTYYGIGPGNVTFHGQTYVGGTNQTVLGQPGNAPGGGGAGGEDKVTDSNPGGAGADGAAWLLAYPAPNVPYGPVTLMPTAFNAQAVLTGATTLFVMLVRSGSTATVTATALRPALHVIPVPA